MSLFQVLLTDDAARDLGDLYDYIATHDAVGKADAILDEIEKAVASLAEQPHRGSYPTELLAVGIREYRELYVKPYRLIYRVIGQAVVVFVIADGRRDFQTLLQRRLLQA